MIVDRAFPLFNRLTKVRLFVLAGSLLLALPLSAGAATLSQEFTLSEDLAGTICSGTSYSAGALAPGGLQASGAPATPVGVSVVVHN